MKKNLFVLIIVVLFMVSCDNDSIVNAEYEPVESSSWVFAANEGAWGTTTGSISMIDDLGNVYETDYIGNTVQSLEVHGDKLIVLVNDPSKIIIYAITPNGLAMPGIEVSTDGSGPREMVVVGENIYFTNQNTSDVKVFNLITYNIDASIPVGSFPEGIVTDGTTIWVANSSSGTVSEIDIATNSVTANHDVGEGPTHLVYHDSSVFISRTFYNSDWTTAYHGVSKITGIGDISINDYGLGMACGGSVLAHNADVLRSFNGGLGRIDSNLNLEEALIGNFTQSQVYHVEKIDGYFWFAITDYGDLNQAHVLDEFGAEVAVYSVGQNPGDFAKWPKINN